MKISNTIYLLLLLITLTVFTSCQKYKIRRAGAFDNIEMLRDNVLLIRLKSADKKIAALQKANNKASIAETKNNYPHKTNLSKLPLKIISSFAKSIFLCQRS